MKLIAWDTSTQTGAVVALEWDSAHEQGTPRLVSEWTLNVSATHSERLLWALHQVLAAARWTIEDVDVLGVGLGPGSFTGLRIGLTTARTIAHALGKPVVGVSSLAVIARAYAHLIDDGTQVVVANDACKGEVYALWGSARSVRDCVVGTERGVHEAVLSPEALLSELTRKKSQAGILALGDAWDRYPELSQGVRKRREAMDHVLREPSRGAARGRVLGQLCWEAFQGGLALPALEVKPKYLRAADAELKLKAGLLPKVAYRS